MLFPVLVVVVAMISCDRHPSDSPARTDANSAVASTATNFVRVAVILPGTVERIRTLLVNAQIKIALEKIVVPAGAVREFPPDSISVSVLPEDKSQAISLLRRDVPKGKYWIQVQP